VASPEIFRTAAAFLSLALSFAASMTLSSGWFWQFIAVESVIAAAIYVTLRTSLAKAKWQISEQSIRRFTA
jgi:hypothetical protein